MNSTPLIHCIRLDHNAMSTGQVLKRKNLQLTFSVETFAGDVGTDSMCEGDKHGQRLLTEATGNTSLTY